MSSSLLQLIGKRLTQLSLLAMLAGLLPGVLLLFFIFVSEGREQRENQYHQHSVEAAQDIQLMLRDAGITRARSSGIADNESAQELTRRALFFREGSLQGMARLRAIEEEQGTLDAGSRTPLAMVMARFADMAQRLKKDAQAGADEEWSRHAEAMDLILSQLRLMHRSEIDKINSEDSARTKIMQGVLAPSGLLVLLVIAGIWRRGRLDVRRAVEGQDLQAEELMRSEERLRLALEGAGVGLYDLDVKSGEAEVTPLYASMLGYDPATFRETNQSWAERMHPDDRESVYGIYEAYVKGELPSYDVEFRQRKADGSWKWIRSLGRIVTHGESRRFIGIHIDVEAKKMVEARLGRSERQMNRAQQLAGMGSWELDLEHNVLEWSDEIFRIFEVDKTRFGASYEAFLEGIHPEDRHLVDEAYRNSLVTRETYRIDHRLLMSDGRIKWVTEYGESFFDDEGKPLRSLGVVHDITEQVETEQALQASVREKETLLREVHHRVKNNLQIISSLLHFQAKKAKTAEELATLREGQDRLRSMILVHEKLYQSEDLAHIEFAGYLRSLVDQLRANYNEYRQRVEFVLELEEISLSAESALPLGMIASELLTNVFKYAFPDDATGTVEVRLGCGEGRMTLVIADTGVGLPPEFDPENAPGFGTRLIHNLTNQLDGKLSYGEGPGALVSVEIPL